MAGGSSESVSKVFPLVVHKTYFKTGFFNVKVSHDDLVRHGEGTVALFLGAERRRIEAKVNRTANPNGTARVSGGVELRDWFQRHCRLGQTVYVDLSSPAQMSITAKPPQDK
jgi:hypothetical protein